MGGLYEGGPRRVNLALKLRRSRTSRAITALRCSGIGADYQFNLALDGIPPVAAPGPHALTELKMAT
jgi:hypothetical protein